MTNNDSKQLHATIQIEGMHCGSCEILLERKLRTVKGLKRISINHKTGIAKLVADADAPPSIEEIEAVVKSAGYRLAGSGEPQECEAPICSVPKRGMLVLRLGGIPTQSDQSLRHKLKSIAGVRSISISSTGEHVMKLYYREPPDRRAIEQAVVKEGYQFISLEEGADSAESSEAVVENQPQKKWLEIGASLIIIFALWKLLGAFNLISLAPATTGALSFGGILLIGLIAGCSSCLAVTGGLLLAVAAKYNEVNQSMTKWQKFKPLLQFNIGRLISYFVLGGVVGLIGQTITLSARMTGYMNIIVAFVMLYLALTILKLIPKGSFGIKPPKALSHWIHDLSEHEHPLAPFALGALTFFLPCGFTQSLQVAALASGNFVTGALTMFVFALGTLPALLSISAISSTASGTASRLFLRFAGTMVLVLAIFNLNSALALTGFDVGGVFAAFIPQSTGDATGPSDSGAAPTVADGVQEVSMKVEPEGYQPNVLTVKAGIPVRWVVDGTDARGCNGAIVVPSLNIYKDLVSGPNIIEFTPSQPGRLNFSCSMGMYRGYFNVI